MIDDRCCMVQLAIRVSQFYEHESCGKCTPVPRGDALADADPAEDRGGTRRRTPTSTCCSTSASGSSASASARSATRTRSRSRATSRSSATSSVAHVEEGGCPFDGASSLDGILAPTDVHAAHVGPRRDPRARWRCSRERMPQRRCVSEPSGHDRRPRGRGREGHGARRDGRGGRDRDPRLLLRAAARAAGRRLPHVPRRGRGPAEAPGRLHAHRAGRDGRAHRRDLASGPPTARARRSSSSSSTTRSTARSATRAASARCRTSRSATGPGSTRMTFPKQTLRQADPDLAADRARPRALHPLLPLHALLRATSPRTAS